MTNKQAIDGVSRESIEAILGLKKEGFVAAWKELRALLDNQSCGSCDGCENGCRLDRESPPAAQPQGEVERMQAQLRVARAQGRAEIVEMIIALEAETGLDEFIGSHQIGCTGEWGSHWKEEELRQHFDVGRESSGDLELARHSGYEIVLLKEECDTLRAQLAERDALLGRIAEYAPSGICAPTAVQGFAIEAKRVLSTSAEPKPARPYPNRICHVEYTAHPHLCGCTQGDEEAQRLYDERYGKPSAEPKPRGEPVAHLSLCLEGMNKGDYIFVKDLGASGNDIWSPDIPVYADQPSHSGDANEMVAKVVLPERKQSFDDYTFKGCRDAGYIVKHLIVAKLNGLKP